MIGQNVDVMYELRRSTRRCIILASETKEGEQHMCQTTEIVHGQVLSTENHWE